MLDIACGWLSDVDASTLPPPVSQTQHGVAVLLAGAARELLAAMAPWLSAYHTLTVDYLSLFDKDINDMLTVRIEAQRLFR